MDLRKLCKRTTYKRVQRQQKGGFFKFGELRERSVLLNNKNDKKNIVFFFFITSYHTEDAQSFTVILF